MKLIKFINSWSIKALLLICVLGASNFLNSCNEPEEMEEVVLQSFGPSGVKHGDQIKFIGINLDKVTAIVLQPGIEVTQFDSKTASLIEMTVPKEAEAGKVVLKTPQGDIESLTMLSFEVPVVVTSITAESRPGGNITITGDLLNWIESITFEDGIEVTEFVSQSLTELVVTVPMDAQTGFLIFKTGGTEPLTFASEEKLIVTLPEVTAITPDSARHEQDIIVTGTDLDLVTSIQFTGDLNVDKANFVSQSATEIVVNVPAMTETGVITLKQLSPIDVVTTQALSIILPVGTSVSPSPAVPGQDDITITGTDLDLVGQLILSGVDPIPAANFVSQSETEIIVTVPAEAKFGPINYVTIHGYAGSLGVTLTIPSEGPPPLVVPVYEEAVTDLMGQGGGWGGATTDFANTENAREGTNAMKVTFAGDWGGAAQMGTWGKDDLSISGTEVFVFSIYGGAGTGGQQLNVNVKFDADNPQVITIVEGEWTDVEIPISDFGNFTAVTEIWFQDRGFSGTVWIDRVGFSMASGPKELAVLAYDDAVSASFGQGGWGGATTDYANTENTRQGSNAIKIDYVGDWSGAPQLGTWGKDNVSIAGTSVFAFSIFGGSGTGGKELNVNVKLDADNPQIITIVEGEWTDVEIPISDFGSFTEITEIWFQDRGFTGTVYIDYIGFR
ncbi:MAG: hypothetical protein ACNS60_11760 [Candidatus Cyclobacteriaceae bacterium M2_1C_046]